MLTAERVRRARLRIAFMVLAALCILATLVYLLTGGFFGPARAILYVFMPDATGIETGSPVRVDGVDVGKIKSVELSGSAEPDRVIRVTLLIDRSHLASITEDSTAQTSADNLLGDMFILITTGHSPRHLRSGAEIPYKPEPALLQSLDLAQFRRRLQDMAHVLDDIENANSPVGKFIVGDQMYRDLRRSTSELNNALRNAAKETGAVGRELYTSETYDKIQQQVRNLDDLLALIQSAEGPAAPWLHDSAKYDEMVSAVVLIREAIREIDSGEYLQSDAAYQGWVRSVSDWIVVVDEISTSPLFTTSAAYDNLTGKANEIRVFVKDFRQNPKKYLRIEMF